MHARIQEKIVMPGLIPGIHVERRFAVAKTWMAGTSPAMTVTIRSIGVRLDFRR
jgi:hypothetical protein